MRGIMRMNQNSFRAESRSIRAVTFDVGGTLIQPWPSVGHVYARVAERFGLRGVSPEGLTGRFGRAWRARRGFDYSRAAWYGLVKESFAGLSKQPPGDDCCAAIFEAFAEPDAWRVYDDVRPTLTRLHDSGVRLGLISNWDERLRPLLAALKLDRCFEVIVISHEVGRTKPDPALFWTAAHLFSLPAETILHVGDSAREDLGGAVQLGMHGLLLHRGVDGEEGSEPGSIVTLDEVTRVLSRRTSGAG